MSIASILSDLWRGAFEAPPQAQELQKSPGRIGLRWLPPVLHFPEPLNFTKGCLAHHDGLVAVLARWCYNSFYFLNSCTPIRNFVSMVTIQRPKYTLYLLFNCILHKKWSVNVLFIASKLFAHQRTFFKKVKKNSVKRFRRHLNISKY